MDTVVCGHCGNETAGPNFCGECGSFLDGEQIENVTGRPLKGQPAGPASSSGRTPMADMSPEGRAAYLRELDVQTAGGPALTEDLTRAEAELAGAEEDWNLTADHLRALRYDVTHTEAGTQRSANPGGDQELAEAERVELRARDRYDAARSRMNQLLAEFQSIDDEGRGRTMPPSWYSSPEAGVRAAQRNASSSATTSG